MIIDTRPLASFGRIQNTFCSEADKVLDAIEVALAEGERVGLTSTSAFATAQRIYDRETWSVGKVVTGGQIWDRPTEPMLPSACARLVGELRAALDALNAAIVSVGGNVSAPPPPEESPIGWIKWTLIGAAGIGALFAVGYTVRAFR